MQATLGVKACYGSYAPQRARLEQIVQMLSVKLLNEAGGRFHEMGRHDEAREFFEAAHETAPHEYLILNNCANSHISLGNPDKAEEYLKKAVACDPSHGATYGQLGAIKIHQNELIDAESYLARAIEIDPWHPSNYVNLAYLYQLTGQRARAEQMYKQAILIDPSNAEVRAWYGMLLILMGQKREGFHQYEARLAHQSPLRPDGTRIWQGQQLTGKSINVFCEQGTGDMIQMARYLPALTSQLGAARVTFICPPTVAELLSSLPGVSTETDYRAARADYQFPIMSFPQIFHSHGILLRHAEPYLQYPEGYSFPELDEARASSGKIQVGFCYYGARAHRNDRFRSIKAAEFETIMDMQAANWWSLHAEPSTELKNASGWPGSVNLLTMAAFISQLDLVITVDTMVAHLAGALGKPVWMLLCANPDWRWGTTGTRTELYPSMRIFRQRTIQEWGPVFEDIETRLKACHKKVKSSVN